uniref:DC-STAMP domain containing 1 n=1 Tax=Acanthochromis polyacanthus TaxID=80966 RepID=A0A3Q1G1K7_9TELE
MTCLPPVVHRFLFSQSEEFPVTHLVLRALFGALSGSGNIMCFCVCTCVPAVCAAGGALSPYFRCSILLMFPSMLGSRGRSYLMLLILSVLYTGPISNIRRNAESAALTLSCNLDLQLHHGRLLWREAVKPFILVTQELMVRGAAVCVHSLCRYRTSSEPFLQIRQRICLDACVWRPGVMNQGIQRCADWFSSRWEACLEAIPVPVINHILCIPMKFHFLCDVMRVMTPWCREHIPVEGNFGQLFDQLNSSVNQLSREFIAESFNDLTAAMEQVFNVLAIGYLRSYMRDIDFDNTYITTYFRQIDARRRKAGKRFLLPLKKSEKKEFIYPWSLKIHTEELQQVVRLFQVMFVSLLSVILLAVDFSLFHVLDIQLFRNAPFSAGSHQVDFRVDGDTIMGRLLRTMVSAFNSSSSLDVTTDNMCMSPPSSLSSGVYISCACCVALLLLLSCLQVYSNRLRRVITAFYYPKVHKSVHTTPTNTQTCTHNTHRNTNIYTQHPLVHKSVHTTPTNTQICTHNTHRNTNIYTQCPQVHKPVHTTPTFTNTYTHMRVHTVSATSQVFKTDSFFVQCTCLIIYLFVSTFNNSFCCSYCE